MKMNNYLHNLMVYFENVLHPAAGWLNESTEKQKRKIQKNNPQPLSPECFNTRGTVIKKQDKLRRNPAP